MSRLRSNKPNSDNVNINWDAAGAIGQWLGAIATFFAVLVALKQNQVRVRVKTMPSAVAAPPHGDGKTKRLIITAVNTGLVPVKITLMGLKFPKNYCIINPDPTFDEFPKTLMPSDEVSVWTKEDDLKMKGVKYFDIAYAVDSSGRIHYQQVSIIRRITRRLWWTFGSYKFQ